MKREPNATSFWIYPDPADSYNPNKFDGKFERPDGESHIDPSSGAPPPVPGGADRPGKGVTSVSTAALKTFATNLDALKKPLVDARDEVVKLKIKPGAFFDAYELAKKVNGAGLVDPTAEFLRITIDAALAMVEKARKMATDYSTVEEFNKITAADFGNYTTNVADKINANTSPGGNSPT